ncbi:hypothetical protein Ddc_11714 [Ditylenchus destructor]|nr:hypothetical protein Ddc_11714 [Ditylenchus destructor]
MIFAIHYIIMVKADKSVTMTKEYIHQIREGRKIVEGRVGIPVIKNIRPGEKIRFFYMSNAKDDVICEVQKVERYKTFEEMLKVVGFKNCLPKCDNIDNAIKAYLSIPKYEERQSTHGVYALHLKLLNNDSS